MARNGKIARLPREIREELNQRLSDGEPGGPLLDWLNAQAPVQAVLARHFEGVPISKQNLCDWRAGGFAEWEARREILDQARDLAADAAELTAATAGRLTDHLATVLAARYAALLAGWTGEVTEEFNQKLRALHGLCRDITVLRRSDHQGARLKMKQERHDGERERTEEEVLEHFQRWAQNPEVHEWVIKEWKTPEERMRRLRELYGLPPEKPAASPIPQPGLFPSSPVQPSQGESSLVKTGQAEVADDEAGEPLSHPEITEPEPEPPEGADSIRPAPGECYP